MANKTKQQLIVENNTSFPTNNAGAITATELRDFNTDMIDSTVNQDVYTTDSGSWNQRIDEISGSIATDTGSLLVTASAVDNVLTFTKGDTSTFNVTVGSVIPSGTISGSSQVILQDTTGLLSGSRIDGAVSNATNAVSASHAEISDEVPFSGVLNKPTLVSGSSQIVLQDTTYTDGQADMFLETDGAGNLIFDWVKTLHQNIHNSSGVPILRGTPLYISGSTGDNANVYLADASVANKRPATLIAYDATLAPNATGTGIISGEIQGVDTSLYPEGTIVYLGVGGGWSATRPTGSDNLVQALGVITRQANNGRGIVFNQIGNNLPNIQEGYVWVGDSTGVPVAVPTASLSSYIFTQNNTFTGTQTFDNIAVNGTGSFAYIESITGSAKIIGDAFIVLNNNTPTERYAGIAVQDSGSAGVTASLQFDGLNNNWFYEYSTDGGVTTDHGVVLFGPEYSDKGTPTYLTTDKLPKSDGGHHLVDSTISDLGYIVSINNQLDVIGNITLSGTVDGVDVAGLKSDFDTLNGKTLVSGSSQISSLGFATTGSNTFVGEQNFTGAVTASAIDIQQGVFGNGINLYQDGFSQIRFWSGSNQSQVGTWVNMQTNPANGALAISSFPANNHFVDFFPNELKVSFTQPVEFNGGITGNTNVTGDLQVSSILEVTGSSTFANQVTINNDLIVTNAIRGNDILLDDPGANSTILLNPDYFSQFLGILAQWREGNQVAKLEFAEKESFILLNGWSGATYDEALYFKVNENGVSFQDWDGSYTPQTWFNISQKLGNPSFKRSVEVTGSLSTTQGLTVTGSISTNVNTLSIVSNTASLDGSVGNSFVLNLVSATDTRLEVTNLKSGQTINLLVSQSLGGDGTLTLAPNLLEPSGSYYSASQIANAQDILTLATFVNNEVVYVANVVNLI